jgi:beta-mannosidase
MKINRKTLATLLSLVVPALCTAAAPRQQRELADSASSRVLSLSGPDWSIHDDPDGKGGELRMFDDNPSVSGWIAATVPGNIQADLESAHQLKPLWYGAGDPRLFDVARKDWWYRKDFSVPESFRGKRITLDFDGVDFDCDVWMNGKWLGRNAAMFRRFWFDVTEQAHSGRVNRLAVRVKRMPERVLPLLLSTDGPGVNGGFPSGIDLTRQILKDLKSPTNWGWDWGTNIWTLGIWKDVRLVATGPARIDWTRVQSALNTDFTQATITATLEIDSLKDLPVKASFRVSGNAQRAEAIVFSTLTRGRNVVEARLTLDKPDLWWPNGQGEQLLYSLHVELQPRAGGPVFDAKDTQFGVRDVRWEHTEGAPANHVSRYQLVINGRPVRTMGSNLIPPDLLFGRMESRTMALLRRAKAAGMNTFRQWGGGVILHEKAYELADELGIMIVLELPLANGWPETDPVFLANLDATARNIVKQLRNHPSIIEFDGGNEMPWNSLTRHPALQLLQKIVAEEDGRMFRATCPDLGATHGPWYFNLKKDCPYFDNLSSMRAGEFGAASPANLEVWRRELPPKSQWPIAGIEEPIQIHKNIVQAVFEPDYWLRKKHLDQVFGSLDSLPDLVKAGQFYGAEGLRYEIDALRRHGKRLGGLTTWDFNEPWPNGAGSFLIDYDGRPLMNYDFVKQALAPISLSLQYPSVFCLSQDGIQAKPYLTSDAPQSAEHLKWQWLARDRRGTVLGRSEAATSIGPHEVKCLGTISIKPPAATALGPVFVELQLHTAEGTLLAERIHVFGTAARASLAGLLRNHDPDQDDNIPSAPQLAGWPDGPTNLAFVGNGAQPAVASSARPEPIHQPRGINDGRYGNDHSWIGTAAKSSFQIDLGKVVTLGRFKLGRDRTGEFSDRAADYVKIETSQDGRTWQVAFEMSGITRLAGFLPDKTIVVNVAPTQARHVRVTVDPTNPAGGEFACVDEFETYAPAAKQPAALPQITFAADALAEIWRPVRRTALQVAAKPLHMEGREEVLKLVVTNTGAMTALFCEPHPLIEYRTDLFIENNHCFIPPRERRTLTIRASHPTKTGISLEQIGWRLSCWNADDVVLDPLDGMLLAIGRRDAMCREFRGYDDPGGIAQTSRVVLKGTRPDPAQLPFRLDGNCRARFEFPVSAAQARRPARLWIHTADQAELKPTKIVVAVNGRRMECLLPRGLGIQRTNPADMAFPASAEFPLLATDLRVGQNILEVCVEGGGWFTWDALCL